MQSGTTHAAHQVITARGLSSGAGLAKEQRPTQHRQSAGLLQTIISVAAWATVLRPCVLTPSGPATAATQVLHACAGMPSIGSAETSHLRKQHNERSYCWKLVVLVQSNQQCSCLDCQL